MDLGNPWEACVRWGRTLAQPGEYDVNTDFLSKYFDDLSL